MTSIKKGMVSPKQTPDKPQMRDVFETPKYAVDVLLPFIPKSIEYVWECAVGNGRISNVLCNAGYVVCSTDIRDKTTTNKDNEIFFNYNFLSESGKPIPDVIHDWFIENKDLCIITNPPFSIKHLFIEKALEFNLPFAFLINADYSGQVIDWIERGCEKIVPKSRISYITPNILGRIREGELWKYVKDTHGITTETLKEFKEQALPVWDTYLDRYNDYMNFSTLEECPQELLYKYSSAQFHSMWLTYKFDLGKTETFIDLDSSYKRTNII